MDSIHEIDGFSLAELLIHRETSVSLHRFIFVPSPYYVPRECGVAGPSLELIEMLDANGGRDRRPIELFH